MEIDRLHVGNVECHGRLLLTSECFRIVYVVMKDTAVGYARMNVVKNKLCDLEEWSVEIRDRRNMSRYRSEDQFGRYLRLEPSAHVDRRPHENLARPSFRHVAYGQSKRNQQKRVYGCAMPVACNADPAQVIPFDDNPLQAMTHRLTNIRCPRRYLRERPDVYCRYWSVYRVWHSKAPHKPPRPRSYLTKAMTRLRTDHPTARRIAHPGQRNEECGSALPTR
jgi:hypothetical protein